MNTILNNKLLQLINIHKLTPSFSFQIAWKGKFNVCNLVFMAFIVSAFCILNQAPLLAQTGLGNYQSGFEKSGSVFSFNTENAKVQISFCTPKMVRIRSTWKDEFEQDEPWMVTQYNWPEVAVQSSENANHFLLKSDSLIVKILKSPILVEISTVDGKILSTENLDQMNGGGMQEGEAILCRKKLMPDEHFFGFGERMDFMDRRGKKLKLNVGRGEKRPHIIGAYNILEANYSPVPFFMSTTGYGLFFHTPYATEWDMGESDPSQFSFEAEGGELDYYFMYGPDFPDILDQYTDLTGKSPLLPEFAMGLHVGTYSGGTWGYEELTSTQYVVALARKFRAMGIPVDVLHLDSTWRIFGKNGGSGATSFEWRETFDNPKAMFDSLYDLHYNFVGLHLRPRFDNGNKLDLLDQARKKGYVYPEENNPGEFVNFFDSAAVDWWWENGVKRVADIGAKFLKTDEGSAFGRKANESNKIGPTGKEIQKLHNVFPIAYAKAPYEKFAEYNRMRGMNHTREGYAGIQRYPFIFAGDWPSEWQYFAPVIKAGLNIGLSGVGYWAHCMGGFEHNADPELYIRWCQFGLMSSISHLFGMDHPGYKEPWNYGEEAERIFIQYDKMRYQLIPYLYSHAYELNQTGKPLMRALVLDYQNDPNTYEIGDQYLLGNSMMICPVTTKGAQTRVVYLPEGNWTNYWTGEEFEGKQYLNVVSPLDSMPMFIKEGAIIPRQPVVQYVSDPNPDTITLDIYPGKSSSFTLYDDDGKSLEYQNGNYATTTISTIVENGQLAVDIKKPQGSYEIGKRSYQLNIHTSEKPTDVKSGGKAMKAAASQNDLMSATAKSGYYFDSTSGILHIKPAAGIEKDIQIIISLP